MPIQTIFQLAHCNANYSSSSSPSWLTPFFHAQAHHEFWKKKKSQDFICLFAFTFAELIQVEPTSDLASEPSQRLSEPALRHQTELNFPVASWTGDPKQKHVKMPKKTIFPPIPIVSVNVVTSYCLIGVSVESLLSWDGHATGDTGISLALSQLDVASVP